MTKTQSIFAVFILILSTSACNAPASPTPTAEPTPTAIVEVIPAPATGKIPLIEAEVSRVTTQDAKAAFDNGTAIIVDVRSQAAYDTSHVAGAINIQLGEFESNIVNIDLPKDQWIITYCT